MTQKQEVSGTRLYFFADGLALACWVARIPEIQGALHLSDRGVGLALLGMAVGALAANTLSVKWAERSGLGVVARVSSLCLSAALLLPGLAWSGASLFVALAILGLGSGCLNVAQNALAAGLERRAQRPMMVSFHALYSAGGLVGALLGAGAAAVHLPPLVHFALAAGILSVVLYRVHPIHIDEPTIETSNGAASSWLPILCLMAFCTVLSEGAMGDWSGIYLTTVLHKSAATGALGYAAFSLCMVLGRCFGDRLSLFFGQVRLLRGGALLAAAGLGATLLGWLPGAELAGFACIGFGCAATYPLLARAAGTARAIAMLSSIGFLGSLCGPSLIGMLSGPVGLGRALGLVVVANLVVAWQAHVVER
ncbi:MAG TPA: MFS transporter [Candidatus Xenobia bacterium]